MKERSITLKPWEVRAFLDGRKTQIRRLMSPQPIGRYQGCAPAREFLGPRYIGKFGAYFAGGGFIPCPFGKPGDRLWVREKFAIPGGALLGWKVIYDADLKEVVCAFPGWENYEAPNPPGCWRRSIYMPRWASRITLEITNIRVERLQDISGPDCWAEGIQNAGWDCEKYGSVTECYRDLWESIHGTGSWATNPWVWVMEVKKI